MTHCSVVIVSLLAASILLQELEARSVQVPKFVSNPGPHKRFGFSSLSNAASSLKDKASDVADSAPSLDDVNDMAGDLADSTLDKATSLAEEHGVPTDLEGAAALAGEHGVPTSLEEASGMAGGLAGDLASNVDAGDLMSLGGDAAGMLTNVATQSVLQSGVVESTLIGMEILEKLTEVKELLDVVSAACEGGDVDKRSLVTKFNSGKRDEGENGGLMGAAAGLTDNVDVGGLLGSGLDLAGSLNPMALAGGALGGGGGSSGLNYYILGELDEIVSRLERMTGAVVEEEEV